MKLECSIEKLKIAINQAERITGKNLTLPVLSCILLIASGKTLKLRATNLSLGIEIEIPAKIDSEGVVVVRGDILGNLLQNIYSNNTIVLESINDNISIKTKNNNILIKNFSHEDFPTIPLVSGKSFSIENKKFIDGIKNVYYSSSISDIKPEISSVYIYGKDNFLYFVATDSFRLAEKKIKIKQNEDFPEVLIPFKNIIEIIKIFDGISEDLKINLNKNQISFSLNNIYLTSRLIDGNFPDYGQIIPKEHKTEVIVLKQELLNALKIANIFSDRFNQVALKIKTKEKTFEFYSKNSDIGENTTKIEATLSGEDVELNFNFKYFLDCFQSIGEDSLIIQMNGYNKPVIIKSLPDQLFTYLVMPMNR